MRAFIPLTLLCLLLASSAVRAHTLAPSLLQIEATEQAGHFQILWRLDMLTPQMQPKWPPHCQTGQNEIAQHGRQLDYRYQLHCNAKASEQQVHIEGLAEAPSAVLLRQITQGRVQEQLIHPRQPYFELQQAAQSANPLSHFLYLGIEHILFGADHLLLVLGLFFIAQGLKPLLSLSLCFTTGHSLTLILASLQWINLPRELVEIAIAISLLYTALRINRMEGSIGRWHNGVFLGIGLIHGLGFAASLGELGLEENQLLLKLFSFNLGVELGQLLILFVLLCMQRAVRYIGSQSQALAPPACSYLIGSMACYWCLDRSLLLLQ